MTALSKQPKAAKELWRELIGPLTPEQYAERHLSWRDARDMFFERLGRAVTAYAALALHRHNRVKAGHVLLRRFEWLWVPKGMLVPPSSSNGLGARPSYDGVLDGAARKQCLGGPDAVGWSLVQAD